MSESLNVARLGQLFKCRGREATQFIADHFQSADNICVLLNSKPSSGLDPNLIELRRQQFGPNTIPPKPPKTFLKLVLEAANDKILIILIIAAVLSFALSFVPSKDPHSEYQWIETVGIMFAVVVVVLVTALNDYQKEKQFIGLYGQITKDKHFSITRGGRLIDVNVSDIVVGDICHLKYGDLIPTDGLILHSNDLRVDESSLTGESDIVKKNKTDNPLVYSGTTVMEGSGNMLVLAVGVHSQSGIIATLLGAVGNNKKKKKVRNIVDKEEQEGISEQFLEEDHLDTSTEQSVLQSKLSKLTLKIGIFGLSMAILTTLTLVLRFVINTFATEKKSWDSGEHIHVLLGHIITGITVLVVALPEGLPLAVTISLAYSVKKMIHDNNLVRHLNACETMGSATTICSDKTGTLTTNRMTVVELFIADKYFKYVPSVESIPPTTLQLLAESISVNTAYTSVLVEDPSGRPKQMGNKTECALLGLLQTLGMDYAEIREQTPTISFHKLYTFNSTRKYMSTVVRTTQGFRLYCKGATEVILLRCSHVLGEGGGIRSLSKTGRDNIYSTVISVMSTSGLRTLCLAFKDFLTERGEPNWEDEDSVLRGMTILAITGIEDPIRDEVPGAIEKVKQAGIVVRMITGDNLNTAKSIAIKCGIIISGDDSLVIESSEFNRRIRDSNNKVKQELLDSIWPQLRVLARSSPTDKYTLINGIINSELTNNRQVVAVTGDGTNDAPALKKADVGFAMGMAGTDVAKQASDIILTDDNFTSIVKAVMWGRNVYDSIAKFLTFQLTVNLVAVVVAFIGSAVSLDSPLSAIQMLWVNLIMDTFASLALATEKPTEKLLKRRPYGRTKALISRNMMKSIVGHAVYQLIVIFMFLFLEDYFLSSPSPYKDYTAIFNVFVIMTLFNQVNCRKIHGERNVFENILKNPMFLAIWGSTFVVHIIIVQFGSVLFQTRPLPFVDWMVCLGFGIGGLLWEQLLIFIPTKKLPRGLAVGRMQQDEITLITEDRQSAANIPSAKILWLRSGYRIQSQLRVIKAFNNMVTQSRREGNTVQTPSVTIL